MSTEFDVDYYLKFGHHRDDIGFVMRNILRLRKSNKILFAPCGIGHVLNLCNNNGMSAKGIDINKHLIDNNLCKKHATLTSVVNIPHYDNEFDLVCCQDLLEHLSLKDIHKAIDELIRVGSDEFIITITGKEERGFYDDPTHTTPLSVDEWHNVFKDHGLFPEAFMIEYGEFVFRKETSLVNSEASVAECISINSVPSSTYFNTYSVNIYIRENPHNLQITIKNDHNGNHINMLSCEEYSKNYKYELMINDCDVWLINATTDVIIAKYDRYCDFVR